MLFYIDGFTLLNPDWTTALPNEGQLVALAPIWLQLSDGKVEKGYLLNRPESQVDNGLWSSEDFERFPIFYPRWREFTDLEIRPRECHGYMEEACRRMYLRANSTVCFTDFESRFSCIARPKHDS
jgi:hypothetical protein